MLQSNEMYLHFYSIQKMIKVAAERLFLNNFITCRLKLFLKEVLGNSNMFIRDSDELNLIWQFEFRPIFSNIPAISINITHFKSSQKCPKNDHLASFIKVKSI